MEEYAVLRACDVVAGLIADPGITLINLQVPFLSTLQASL